MYGKMWFIEQWAVIGFFIIAGVISLVLCDIILNKLINKSVKVDVTQAAKHPSKLIFGVSAVISVMVAYGGYQYYQQQPISRGQYEKLGSSISEIKLVSPISYKQIATEFSKYYEDHVITKRENVKLRKLIAVFWDEEMQAFAEKKIQTVNDSLQNIVKDSTEFDAESHLSIDEQHEKNKAKLQQMNMEITALLEEEKKRRELDENYDKAIDINNKNMQMMK